MIVLLDTSEDLTVCEAEIGCAVGQLLTPLTRFRLQDASRLWAIDNGAFSEFNAQCFASLLVREDHHKANCLFVAVPDVVGSARRTLEIFEHWKDRFNGWKLALVAQDGQEHLPIPWGNIDAVFIGGTTAFKVSQGAAQIIRAAKILGKWVHVGRVNEPHRFEHFIDLGVDSIDGTGISRYSHMRQAISMRDNQERLFAHDQQI